MSKGGTARTSACAAWSRFACAANAIWQHRKMRCSCHPHILTFVSHRPFGVSIMNAGGLKGYSAGSRMRPWYTPPW